MTHAIAAAPKSSLQRVNRGRGHSYKLGGKPVDGVTTLIGKGLPKTALMYWSARCVAEYVADADPSTLEALRSLGRDGMVKALKDIPWTQRDAAAVRGTDVHTLADQLVRGHRVEVPEELVGHVEACLSFLDLWRPTPVLVEAVVASRAWHYAGTLDLVADLPDGRRVLMDWKTGASGVWPEVALQLAAYRHAEVYADADGREHWMEDLGIVGAYAIHLRADGTFEAIPVETGEDQFQAFLHVAHVARQIEGMKGWLGEPEQWGEPA